MSGLPGSFVHEKVLRRVGVAIREYVVYSDNQSIIHLSKNFVFQSRSTHVDLRYH